MILAVAVSVLLSLYPKMVQAQQVPGLYKAEVPIESQSGSMEKEAMGQALEDVLVKVTGETRSLANSALKKAVSQPDQYVKGYSYRRDNINARQLYLQVTFVTEAVNRLLREAGLAIWGGNRPTTLLLLAIDQGRGRTIQRDNSSNPLVHRLEQRFNARSLPLVFPLMDFEDSQTFSPVDVWGFFTDKLTPASDRYGAGAILAGRLSENNGIYNGRLALVFRGQRQEESEVTGLTVDQLSLVAADLVGSTLSSHYAVASLDSQESTRLLIEQVKSAKAYSDLLSYLEKLTAVRSVKVRRVAGTTIELELSIDGHSGQLADTIALGRRLQRLKNAKAEPLAGTAQGELHYRWIQR